MAQCAIDWLAEATCRIPPPPHEPGRLSVRHSFPPPSFPTSLPPFLCPSSAPIPHSNSSREAVTWGLAALRGRHGKKGWQQEGDVREKRQSCCHTKQRVRERGEEQEREKIKISSLSQHSLTMTPGESFRSNEPENAEPPLPFILLSTTLSHHRATITFISERTVLA